MNRGSSDICPVCGNYKVNGICLRCNANAATRAKHWRSGDRGGVRPERRKFYKPKLDKKQSDQSVAPVQKVKRRRKIKAYKPSKKFLNAMQGIWYSEQKKVRVNIDLATNHWVFTLSSGKHLVQIWNPAYYSAERLRFSRNDKDIVAMIGDGGVLMMTGKSGPVPFVSIRSGKKHRLCKMCFSKSPWGSRKCKRCGHKF